MPKVPKTPSNVVRSAHLDPDCEGCQAAKRALAGEAHLAAMQSKRIRGLAAENRKLREVCSAAADIASEVEGEFVANKARDLIRKLEEK